MPNAHENCPQMRRIVEAKLLSAETASALRSEVPEPLADSPVRDDDPPHTKKLFEVSEAETQAAAEPDGQLLAPSESCPFDIVIEAWDRIWINEWQNHWTGRPSTQDPQLQSIRAIGRVAKR